MLDPLESALWGFLLFPYLFYYIFERWGKIFGTIISLTFLTIIGMLIAWITLQTT